jgi:hypothetical protein
MKVSRCSIAPESLNMCGDLLVKVQYICKAKICLLYSVEEPHLVCRGGTINQLPISWNRVGLACRKQGSHTCTRSGSEELPRRIENLEERVLPTDSTATSVQDFCPRLLETSRQHRRPRRTPEARTYRTLAFSNIWDVDLESKPKQWNLEYSIRHYSGCSPSSEILA